MEGTAWVTGGLRSADKAMSDWPLWFRLIIAILATWRVAHLIASEDGPFDSIVWLRARAGNGVLGQLMDCPYCLSMWVAIPFGFSLANSIPAWFAAWLAISGGAALLECHAQRTMQPAHPPTESNPTRSILAMDQRIGEE